MKSNMDSQKLTLLLVACLAAAPALAMTDAEMEVRFKKYEERINSLEDEVKTLRSAARNESPVYVEDLQKQITRNEQRVEKIKSGIDSKQQKLKISGFMTAAVAEASKELGGSYNFDDKPSFIGDSRMGLQFNYYMDKKTDATIQAVARSRGRSLGYTAQSWDVFAEWAYLGYQLTDDLKLRMGRLRVPLYMYSETLDVGYTYPWVRPPLEMYTTTLTSYNGADALYKFSNGPINSTLQFFAGASARTDNTTSENTRLDLGFQDMYGVNITSTWRDWTARAMATTFSVRGDMDVKSDSLFSSGALASIPASSLPGKAGFEFCDKDISGTYCAPGGYMHKGGADSFAYYALGTRYDDGSIILMSEIAHLYATNSKYIPGNVSGYITGGYRLGLWTPYTTFAKTYDDVSTADLAAEGLRPAATQSWSFGLRRELTDMMSAKFEWNHFYNMEAYSEFNRSLVTSTENLSPSDVYTFALDAVF